MYRITATLFFVTWAGCTACPECPPCPGADKAVKDSAKASAMKDAAAQETDAGVGSSTLGGKPKEVSSFELHGRAGFDKVNIFEKPDMDSPRLGYMRKGQRTRVGDPEFASESCPKGWFKLPEGGFVCQGRGMLVGNKPRFIRRVPPKARVDELDPYRHGFIRRDWTPAYKRIPADEEIWVPPSREIADAVVPDGGTPPTETIQHDEDEADGGVDYYKYTKRNFRGVRALLTRGFWVSVGARRFDEATRKYYYETIKDDFVPGDRVHLIKPPKFQGYEVLGDSPLPGVIVTNRHASFFKQRRERFRGIGPVARLSVYRVFEIVESRGVKFYKIEGDRWLKSTQTELFEVQPPPEGIGDKEKWIRVDLTRQTLVAYEGAMPVYATLVSTGLPESEETITPKGRFNIHFKHLTDDMAGTVGDDEVYSVEDVPWVQYIHRNVAFHSSFWHSSYGRPKSHGCINLAPADARWLFNWTEPRLPPKWHGVSATDKNPGTVVIIEGTTPT
ncbi:MAG: L,D-transpeptidase [Deltaproteobacteria bacterium]|nr:L,D-transpeptidase [Deltaproteobacteria bacterium]